MARVWALVKWDSRRARGLGLGLGYESYLGHGIRNRGHFLKTSQRFQIYYKITISRMSVNVWSRGDISSESQRKGGNLKTSIRARGMM